MDPLTILGGVLAIGGAVAGGIGGAKAANKAAAETAAQKRKNRAWYEYNMAVPYTQRADALASIKKAREIFMERNKNASATAAVSGATDEAAAMEKEGANKVIEDTMANIAAAGEERKDHIEEAYMNRDAQLSEQTRQTEIAKANAIAGAGGQVSKVGANMVSASANKEQKVVTGGGQATVITPSTQTETKPVEQPQPVQVEAKPVEAAAPASAEPVGDSGVKPAPTPHTDALKKAADANINKATTDPTGKAAEAAIKRKI